MSEKFGTFGLNSFKNDLYLGYKKISCKRRDNRCEGSSLTIRTILKDDLGDPRACTSHTPKNFSFSVFFSNKFRIYCKNPYLS